MKKLTEYILIVIIILTFISSFIIIVYPSSAAEEYYNITHTLNINNDANYTGESGHNYTEEYEIVFSIKAEKTMRKVKISYDFYGPLKNLTFDNKNYNGRDVDIIYTGETVKVTVKGNAQNDSAWIIYLNLVFIGELGEQHIVTPADLVFYPTEIPALPMIWVIITIIIATALIKILYRKQRL